MPADPTGVPQPELREQAIAHITHLRRYVGVPQWNADNYQSADLLERYVATLDAVAAHLMADPTPTELTRELRDAVGLFSGAMPITPRQAWDEAIAVAKRAVRERDALSSIVRHHQAGHEAVDGLWVVDDGTSITPRVVGEVTPAEADVMSAPVVGEAHDAR